jgi:hypothetical protein
MSARRRWTGTPAPGCLTASHPGTVVKGLGIIQNVAKGGTDNATGPGDGHPKEKVVIERVTIKKT